jgi:hypothetical protein
MTRDQLINLAGVELGDNSTDFKAVLDPFYDDIMQELAAEQLLDQLKATNPFTTVLDQENYSTLTLTGLSVPPVRVLDIRVPTWGSSGIIKQAESHDEYELHRQAMADLRGRFRLWRIFPNLSQLQFWPPVDTENVGVSIGEILFLKPPTAIAGGATIEEIDTEDLPTLKWGVVRKGAPFRDETLVDLEKATAHFEAGKRRMRARIYNQRPTRVYPRDF